MNISKFFKTVKTLFKLGVRNILKLSEENAELKRQLEIREKQAMRDSLTDLFNLRFLEEVWNKAREQSIRYQKLFEFAAASIVCFDVDDLRVINNTQGHIKGDQVLKRVADVIKSYCRSADIPVRVGEGADEYLILLPETDINGAERFAQRVKMALEQEKIYLSYGVASFYEDVLSSSLEGFRNIADKRLYQNKQGKELRRINV